MLGFLKKQKWRSPNYNERVQISPDRAEPSMIILHYTGMQTGKAALERLCDPTSEVSAHYVVEENGETHQLVDEDKRAWHAGVSCWMRLTDINSASIGIELINKGHEFGYEDFPKVQLDKLLELLRSLCDRHHIKPDKILAHSDIAPSRKIDPGEKFPWVTLAQDGFSLWPKPEEMDFQAAEDLILNEDAVLELLGGFGYNIEEDFNVLVSAFHRHFYPEKFKEGEDPASLDIASLAKLLSLIRQQHEA